MSALRGIVILQLATQLAMGVLGFAFQAEALFPDLRAIDLLVFRLAAWANLAAAGLGAWLVAARDPRLLRAVAVSELVYHTLAAWEGASRAWIAPVPELAELCAGAASFHGVWVVLLIVGLRTSA
jgi:hypothetical protein